MEKSSEKKEKSVKKKKVCFVSPFAYSLFNESSNLEFGGAEVQMNLISKELAKDDNFDVNFLVLDLGQASEEIYDNVKLFKAYKRGRGLFNLVLAPLKLINTLRKINPDIVICRAVGVEAGICSFYAKIFGKKFIYSIAHDNDINGSFFKGIRGRIFKFGFENADKLVAQNIGQVNDFKERYSKKENLIDLIKNSLKTEKKEIYPKKEDIFWVGTSADMKQPQIFIDLVKDFPDKNFTMVMGRSGFNLLLWDDIYKQSKNLDNLKFIEKLPFSEIEEYYKKARVFVSTSKGEGFPNTFLQAMNNGASILSLKVNPDDFITKYECGLVCEDDYDKLKKNLKLLLEDNAMCNNFSDNGFEYINNNHNISFNIKKWKDILIKI